MIGVVLAGGKGTRLLPITKYINKNILPVGAKPMIYYPLNTLISSGIKKIIVVIGAHFGQQVKEVVTSFGLDAQISFTVQKNYYGMPDAIYTVKNAVSIEPIIVVGGDNIFGGAYTDYISNFNFGEVSFLRKVDDPTKSAVPIYSKDLLIDVIEKPKITKSKYAICGPHIFDNKVFKIIESLNPSSRGELEIVDLHKYYLKKRQLRLIKASDYWIDAGTFDDLAKASYKLTHDN